jgi:hypothetical protein
MTPRDRKITSFFKVVKKAQQIKQHTPQQQHIQQQQQQQHIQQRQQQQQHYSTDQQQCHQIGSCSYTARMSKDSVHRYQLTRTWDKEKEKILFIMCNPSTASATKNDPTIKKITKYAKSWGYGGIVVGNIFAFRSAYPKDLKTAIDPEGKKNRKYVQRLIKNAEKVVYAWGCGKKEPKWLRDLMSKHGKIPYCMDVLKSGAPCHPLKRDLPDNAQLIQYR